RLAFQLDEQRPSLMKKLLPRPSAVFRSDRILAEQRERDRGIAVRHDSIGEYAWIHLAPAHGFGRRRARQAAPDRLIGRDLDEVLGAALLDAVGLPQRRLGLQVEVLRRS